MVLFALLMLSPQTAPTQTAPTQTATQALPDQQAATGRPPQRIRSVTVRGNEQCPSSTDQEVVVCARVNDEFRIPAPLREATPGAANQAWTNRAETVDQVSRVAGGLPDTCSPVGTGGQTGCAQSKLRDWYAEKNARESATWQAP